jgi:hypothetical protein
VRYQSAPRPDNLKIYQLEFALSIAATISFFGWPLAFNKTHSPGLWLIFAFWKFLAESHGKAPFVWLSRNWQQ